MKKNIFFSMIALVAIAISGCQEDDNYISNPTKEKATHQVRVDVSNAESRTSIEAVPGGYMSNLDEIYFLNLGFISISFLKQILILLSNSFIPREYGTI